MADEPTPRDSEKEGAADQQPDRPRLRLKRIGQHGSSPEKPVPPEVAPPAEGPSQENLPPESPPLPTQPHPPQAQPPDHPDETSPVAPIPLAPKAHRAPASRPAAERPPEAEVEGASRSKLLFMAAALFLILAAGAFFWLRSGTEAPAQGQTPSAQAPDASAQEQGGAASVPPEETADLDQNLSSEVKRFTDLLQNSTVEGSSAPKGLFVEGVFIPEGALLNRELNLVLTRVETGPNGLRVALTTATGRTLQVTLAP